jgi:hypothetical protein
MTGIATAPEFQATAEGGHTFQDAGTDTGLFLNDNNEPEIKVNNVTKATVRNTPSLTSSDTTLVTTAMLQQFQTNLLGKMFPIGISLITQDSRNPSEYLGFGSWERDLEGRALVGYSSDVTNATPDWMKAVNNVYGVTNNTITVPFTGWGTSGKNAGYGSVYDAGRLLTGSGKDENSEVVESVTEAATTFTSQINNVQPSKVKFIFTRLS